MSQAFDAGVERAHLAATDLLAAARQVIAWHSMRPEDARDDVDFAVLSRRITSYAPSWRLDDALDDVDFASRARALIGGSDRCSARTRPSPASDGLDISAATATTRRGRSRRAHRA
jgi:hypothetical protein